MVCTSFNGEARNVWLFWFGPFWHTRLISSHYSRWSTGIRRLWMMTCQLQFAMDVMTTMTITNIRGKGPQKSCQHGMIPFKIFIFFKVLSKEYFTKKYFIHDEKIIYNSLEIYFHLGKFIHSSLMSFWNRFALVVLTLCFSIFFLVVYMDQNLPTPLTLQDVTKHPEKFIEERARNALKKLTSVGSRPTGTLSLSVKCLQKWISGI